MSKLKGFAAVLVALLAVGAVQQVAFAAENEKKQDFTVRYFVFTATAPTGHKGTDKISQDFKPFIEGSEDALKEESGSTRKAIEALLPGYKIQQLLHGKKEIAAGQTLSETPDPNATIETEKSKGDYSAQVKDEFAIIRLEDASISLAHKGSIRFSMPELSITKERKWHLSRTIELGHTYCSGFDFLDDSHVIVYCYCILPGKV